MSPQNIVVCLPKILLYVSPKCQTFLCVAPCHNKSVSLVNWPSDRAVKQGCLLKVSELHTNHT
jgi:hypothetical protein